MNAFKKHSNISFLRQHNSNYRTIIKNAPGTVRYDICDYNCFGYAMGYYDWLDFNNFYCLADEYAGNWDALNDMFEDCCSELEENYKLKRVFTPDVRVASDEYIIAFRVGFDDFHFARLLSDGTWSHKPGGNYIRQMDEKEFKEAWCPNRKHPYVSEIAYFVVTKGSKWYE